MKTKYLLSFLLCAMLTIPTAEAQLFKKIKDKILNKTEAQQTEEPGQDNTEDEPTTNEETAEEKAAKEKKVMSFFGGGLEDIPDTYKFSYALTYEITTNKETMPLHYLLEPDSTYFANKMDDPRASQIMVYDLKKSAMVTFMDNGKQKMAMKMKMPNVQKAEKKFGKKLIPDEDENIEIISIKGKRILEYDCLGFQVTSKDGIGKFWITNDAPVSLNGVYANFKTLSKKPKYQTLQLDENSLILEMTFDSHKKKKDTMHMVCTELKENPLEIHKKDYKSGM
jgi:hypothetical protein